MKHGFASGVLVACLLLGAVANVSANINFDAIDSLPPAEQYRQLSLVLMIAGGANPALIEVMLPGSPEQSVSGNSDFDPDAYKTPLTRIVDQESMLNGAALLLRFAMDSGDDIKARLTVINAENLLDEKYEINTK